MAEYISREETVDDGYLSDWYIASVGDESPVWTDAHIDELLNDFIVIPKDTKAADVQPVKHGRWLPSDSCITAAYGTIHCQICSECGADLMEDNDYDYDFCPVCGTRMDLKGGDEE